METDKKLAKACCSREHDKLKAHLKYCDSPSRTEASLLSLCRLAERSTCKKMRNDILIPKGCRACRCDQQGPSLNDQSAGFGMGSKSQGAVKRRALLCSVEVMPGGPCGGSSRPAPGSAPT